MSTEIVKADEALPSQEDVGRQLDRLEASGDTRALNEVARMAHAYQQYEVRAGAVERANHFGRIKVMAEARIGSIDLELHATWKKAPLEFDGWVVPVGVRGRWRTLGAGLQTGQLDKAMVAVEKDDGAVSTYLVVKELCEAGVLWVGTEPLLKRYRELYEAEGLTVQDVAKQAGLQPQTLRAIITRPGTTPVRNRVARHTGLRIADALGLPPTALRSAGRKNKKVARKRRMRKARTLPGGRLDETYTLIRRALSELDSAVGSSGRWDTSEAYEHLYKAEEIIGRALKRATYGTDS